MGSDQALFENEKKFENPFWDVQVEAHFIHAESGNEQTIMGFYNGKDDKGLHTWEVR